MPFQIIRNDITKVKADIIVNTANPKPTFDGGVDSAIYEAAGKEKLLAERKKIGDIAPGEAAITPAFSLNAKYIIHTVGTTWKDGKHSELETLKSCYEKSLDLALQNNCESIAFPLIDNSGLDDVTVYKKANITKKVFSDIKTKKNYRPSKKTAVAFAIALELSLDETVDLLQRAGMALSPSSKFDLIVRYYISHGIYDMMEINLTLFKNQQECLGAIQ